MSNACTTDPAILCAERTGYAPGHKPEKVERHYPITKSCDMDKSNRFYKLKKKLESIKMSLDITFGCKCKTCGNEHGSSFNITHNLGSMAEAAGIYKALWRPDRNGFKKAGDIIDVLSKGIAEMKADPKHFKMLDAENGWGTYDHFMPKLDAILSHCKRNPESLIFTCK